MTRFSATTRISAILTYVVLLSAAAFGQQVTGTILGRVTDTTGSVVPSATIQILNVDTSFSRTEQADADGRYLSSNLPPGSYSVTVQKQGFKTLVRSGIVLTVGSEATVNAELAVGDVQQHVEVTGEAPQIETTNATLSGLVDQDQLRDLPLNGRSVDQLALLSPGVFANRAASLNASVGVGMHLSINGARSDSTLYLLDGTVVNDDTANGHGSATGQSLGVEGILEFRLLTHNFSAEYGRNAGGVVSAVTRSGTNQFHGSAYEFVRNNIFDARNAFNPGALPAFRRNQFGAAAGGPLRKDRIFFFVNYEGLRQRQGNTQTATVPDLNARMGLVPNSSGVPTLVPSFDLAVVPYLNVYPLPNGINNGDGTAQSVQTFNTPSTENYAMERMDFRLSDKDNFYLRYVYDPSETEISPTAVFANKIIGVDQLFVLSETHIFSGATLNEFRFAFNRTIRDSVTVPLTPISSSLDFVPGEGFGTITFSAGGGSGGQLSNLQLNPPNNGVQNLFQETDTVTTVRGAHSLKFGVDLERVQLNILLSKGINGSYQFGGLQSLLQGLPSKFSITLTTGQSNPERGYRRILLSGFVQDDFRVRPNLTLNLGLRYEAYTNPSEVNGRTSYLMNLTDSKNTPGPPFETPKDNFAPRFGLAWDPTGSGKTSVRLGAGVFYNQLDGREWVSNAIFNSDFLQAYTISKPLFPNWLAAGTPNLAGAQQDQQVQFHSKTPTVIQYNLEVQRQLTPTLSFRVGYVGSHGYNLSSEVEQDIRIPQIQADGSKFFPSNAQFVNPNFSTLQAVLTNADFNYNGLQMTFQKTFSAGLTFQASYTYSKAQSDADQSNGGETLSGPNSVMDPSDIGRDYSLSAYDQRHTFVMNGAYQMPWDKRLNGKLAKTALGGWSINGLYSYGSGLPLSIQTGFNNSNDGDSNNPDRPNLTPGFSQNPINGVTAGCQGILPGQQLHTPARWFDPCAFTLNGNVPGTFGNLGRYTVTGPDVNDVDFTLVKDTPLTERKKLEFRAEFFNLLNHANFGLPNLAVFSSSGLRAGNAGVINNTSIDNREIQLGLKFVF